MLERKWTQLHDWSSNSLTTLTLSSTFLLLYGDSSFLIWKAVTLSTVYFLFCLLYNKDELKKNCDKISQALYKCWMNYTSVGLVNGNSCIWSEWGRGSVIGYTNHVMIPKGLGTKIQSDRFHQVAGDVKSSQKDNPKISDTLWIELPENPANTYARHTETLDTCFNLIRPHHQSIPWFPPLGDRTSDHRLPCWNSTAEPTVHIVHKWRQIN